MLRFILGDQISLAIAGGLANALCDRGYDVLRARIVDILRGIEAQTVEMKLFDPVARVIQIEIAHRPRLEIDRLAPVVLMLIREVLVGERFNVIAVGAEVVIYNLSLIHISEPTRQAEISYAVFCL